MRGFATFPQGDQEPLAVRQAWKTHRWAWSDQVHEMWYFFLQCFDTVGWAL